MQEWKDTEEEKVKLISRVFDERESRDKAAKKKSSSSSTRPSLYLSLQSPLDAISTPRSKDSYQRPRVSPFGGILTNSPPSSPGSLLPPRDSFPLKTRNLLSLTSVQAVKNKVLPAKKKTIKGLSSPAPSTKEGGAEVKSVYIGRTLSRHSDSLQWCCPTLHRSLELHSNNKPSDLLQAAKKLLDSRAIEEVNDTSLLQSPLSGSQTRRIFPSNQRSQEVKSVSGHTFFQNGNSFLHHRSSTTTRMGYQDRPQRCLSSYPGPCEHPQVLSLYYSWKDLSVPCIPVWSLDGTPRVYQDLSTSGSTRTQGGGGGAVTFLVVGTIGQGERPPRGQLWMEQCLTSFKYWPI